MEKLHVDDTVCISLQHRADRRCVLEKTEWNKLGFTPRYFMPEKDEEDPQRGCFTSHKTVVSSALENSMQNLLVLEDDVFFEFSFDVKLIKKINFFINNYEFDVLFLGQIVRRMWPVWPSCGVVGARGAGTQGYIISQQGMNKLVEMEYRNKGIDSEYKQDHFDTYCICPMIASQRPQNTGDSDLTDYVVGRDYWLKNKRKQYWSLLSQSYKFFNVSRWPKKKNGTSK